MSGGRVYQECTVLGVVVAGHLLLAIAFLQLIRRDDSSISPAAPNRNVLILIEPPPTESGPRRVETPRASRVERARSSSAISLPPLEPPPSREESPPAPIDWRLEGERAARAITEEVTRDSHQPLGPQPQPRGREDKPQEFEWNPEPKRVDFAGGLPYVRLGKRCVVGLGFFGCAIGELPEANGDLFEGMRDPNRPTSSVPDPQK